MIGTSTLVGSILASTCTRLLGVSKSSVGIPPSLPMSRNVRYSCDIVCVHVFVTFAVVTKLVDEKTVEHWHLLDRNDCR